MADSMSDFGRLGNEYNVAQPDPALAANMQDLQRALQTTGPFSQTPQQFGLQGLADLSSNMVAQQKMNANPMEGIDWTIKHDKETGEPRFSASGFTADQIQFFSQAAQFQKEALGGFHQQAQQISQELQRAQAQPWQQLGTALAANMANQPGMPGWVRGLGQTAAQMNPTVDQLRAQYLGTLRGGAEIAKDVRAEDIAQQRTNEESAQRRYSEALRLDTQRRNDVEKKFDNAMQEIRSGTGEVNAKAIQDGLVAAGALPKELDSMMSQLGATATSVQKKFNLERADKAEAQALAEKNYNQREKNIERLGTQFATMLKSQETRQDERLAQALYVQQNAAYKTNTKLDTSESTAIRSAFNVLDLGQKLDEVAKTAKPDRITGTLQYKNPFRPAEWQAMKVYSTQLLLSGLAGKLGAGVSDRDVEVMKSIVPGGNLTPGQFEATQKILRTVNEGNLVRMMEINPNVQFWKTSKPLFEKAGLQKVYEREMTNMEAELGEAYPAVFGQGRSKLAEQEYGPLRAAPAQTAQKPFLDESGTQRTAGGKLVFVKSDGSLVFEDGSPVPKRK